MLTSGGGSITEVLEAQAGSNPGLLCVGEDTSAAAGRTVTAGATAVVTVLLLGLDGCHLLIIGRFLHCNPFCGWGLWNPLNLSANATRAQMSPQSCLPSSVRSILGSRCRKRYWNNGWISMPKGHTDSIEARSWEGLLVTQRPQLEQYVHLLLVRQQLGLQEPKLGDIEGVDRWDVVDDVHHLCQGCLREGSYQQVEHHSLAGDVAGAEFNLLG